jgi:hypothetical protein
MLEHTPLMLLRQHSKPGSHYLLILQFRTSLHSSSSSLMPSAHLVYLIPNHNHILPFHCNYNLHLDRHLFRSSFPCRSAHSMDIPHLFLCCKWRETRCITFTLGLANFSHPQTLSVSPVPILSMNPHAQPFNQDIDN